MLDLSLSNCRCVAGGGYYKYTTGLGDPSPEEDVHTPLVRFKRQGDEKVSRMRAALSQQDVCS